MTLLQQNGRLAAVIAVAAVATGAWTPADDAHASAPKLTKERRTKIRGDLHRQLERDPTVVFRKGFLRKAALIDFKLPLTVRLGQPPLQPQLLDDQLEITWDNTGDPYPAGFTPAGIQTVTITKGEFTMEADFGGDASGYGELGAVETLQGLRTEMHTEPFAVAAPDPTCDPLGNPADALTADRSAGEADVTFTSGGLRYGVLNMFAQKIRGSIAVSTRLVSRLANGCDPAPGTLTEPASAGPAMPLRYDGKFYVSPAITGDGKMRLGKIIVDDPSSPGAAAGFKACVTTSSPCTEDQFPARIKIRRMTADVLLGDIRSSSSP